MDTNNSNSIPNSSESQANSTEPASSAPQNLLKKTNPGFPLHRPGPPSRGPILGRGKGGGVGGKGRIGMRTGTR